MKGFAYLSNVSTLKLEREKCVGCGRCIEVCPHRVFSLVDQIASIIDLNACIECGACSQNCPFGAIEVDAGVGCAAGLISEWLTEMNICKRGKNCCS
jgi:ferredoxin